MKLLQRLLDGVEAWHEKRIAADALRFPKCRNPRCGTRCDVHSRGYGMWRGCCSVECHETVRSYLPMPWPRGGG